MIINKFTFVWEGTYGWSFVSETICINYSTGRKQNNRKNTSAINVNMYLYFQYLLCCFRLYMWQQVGLVS
jgi:hypothetical protein